MADGTPPVSSVECLFLLRRDTPEGPQTTHCGHFSSYAQIRENVCIRIAAMRPGTTAMGANQPSRARVCYIRFAPQSNARHDMVGANQQRTAASGRSNARFTRCQDWLFVDICRFLAVAESRAAREYVFAS